MWWPPDETISLDCGQQASCGQVGRSCLRLGAHGSPLRPRGGAGIGLAFVLWVVAIAAVYAMISGQATTQAFGNVARVKLLEVAVMAGQSALDEAIYAIQNGKTSANIAATILSGRSTSGDAYAPDKTLSVFQQDCDLKRLQIDHVMYRVFFKAPSSPDPSQPGPKLPDLVELSVKVRYDAGPGMLRNLTRTVRRLYPAQVYSVVSTLGPRVGKTVYSQLGFEKLPILEEVE